MAVICMQDNDNPLQNSFIFIVRNRYLAEHDIQIVVQPHIHGWNCSENMNQKMMLVEQYTCYWPPICTGNYHDTQLYQAHLHESCLSHKDVPE